jgi:hypothetical protein
VCFMCVWFVCEFELIDYTSMTRNISKAHKDDASKMLSVYMITLSAFCVVSISVCGGLVILT